MQPGGNTDVISTRKHSTVCVHNSVNFFVFLYIYIACDVGSMNLSKIAFMQGDQGKEQPCTTLLVACPACHYATYYALHNTGFL
jgi:hypothetical protein